MIVLWHRMPLKCLTIMENPSQPTQEQQTIMLLIFNAINAFLSQRKVLNQIINSEYKEGFVCSLKILAVQYLVTVGMVGV